MRHSASVPRLTLRVLAALAASAAVRAGAQTDGGTVEALIVARVLAFDRALSERSETSVNVGVLVRAGDASSATQSTVKGFLALRDRTIQGRGVAVSARAYRGLDDLESWIASEKVAVVYVLPPLAEQTGEIGAVLRRKGVVSIGPDRQAVQGGYALAIVADGGKHKLLLNTDAVKALRMDLDPKVLELAEPVKPK